MENNPQYKQLEALEQKIAKDIELFSAARMYFISIIHVRAGTISLDEIEELCKKWRVAKDAIEKAAAVLTKIKAQKCKYASEYQLNLDAILKESTKRKQQEDSPPNKKQKEDAEEIMCTNYKDDNGPCVGGIRSECGKCDKDICETCYEFGYESQPDATEVDEVYCDECFKKWTFYTIKNNIREFELELEL